MISESSTESIPHPLAKGTATVVPPVPQGEDITAAAEPYLGYLTDLSRQLGLIDPVETYFRPLVGRWADPKAVRVEHTRKTYFFCSDHCAHTFKADPKRYTKSSAAPAEAKVAQHVH